jgi:hypothetical protein
MNIKILDKNNYLKATSLEDSLKPLLKELDELMTAVHALHQADSRFSELETLFLRGFVALSELAHTLGVVAESDKNQAEGRGMRELVQLCNARLHEIPELIRTKHRAFLNAKIDFAAITNDLQMRGYKPDQIKMIMATTPKPDEAAHHTELVNLEREQAALTAFVNDFPVYNQELLKGTEFEHWTPEKVIDFEAAAKRSAYIAFRAQYPHFNR